MIWNNTETLPDDGTWCWLSDGKVIWIGCRDQSASGGWMNDDCWEDVTGMVRYWIPIDEPDLPQQTA